MAGPRTNLAVTKDGEIYNKLQRPNDFLDQPAGPEQTVERKRERGALDTPVAGPFSGNKRAKTQHVGLTVKSFQSSDDRNQYRGGGPIAECGMRTTLPIDEEDALYSDDSMGDALAYLRGVRSEASAIPHLLVAANELDEETNTEHSQAPTAFTGHRTFYRDGAWITVEEGYDAAYGDDYASHDPDPKDIYYKQLVRRFKTLRHTLSQHGAGKTPQQDADSNRSSYVKPPSNRHEWLYTIDREYPIQSQIRQLDEVNVRQGLQYCAHAMDRFETISSQKSCWIWTLLALSGDVGTLDSQKMSHIRDIGTKAGEMSVGLRSSFARQTKESRCGPLNTDPACVEQSDEPEAACCDAGVDDCNSEAGYVQSCVSEDLHSEAHKKHNEDVSKTQRDLLSCISSSGTSEVLIDSKEGTNTDTNDDTLERARARLLAQLGDNLVQAGIPAPTPYTGDTHPHHSARPDPGLDELQHETKIRVIPSRAEAERQRQLMRATNSATASLKEEQLTGTGLSSASHSVGSDNNLDDSDLNTRATIDMILTVVAECYGQRDLLRFRKPW
ncbi:uncharacterized protein M421DRAFT_415356 [Didymella exigua CBS 183.55]|uniref:Uncharacterized protein n=1 Tax=Didymella exigua CBS 183.55 TaxID=1150837 RepID=A0A6A5S4Q1_9PLEO|nr:uncharacterized protein M421DRAFT_415356 [Didymella exigua CBS 183.55]KAF1934328.1 hypothetical protein M421DRAFT_415356 [Didymella exigua CBS 183.55]